MIEHMFVSLTRPTGTTSPGFAPDWDNDSDADYLTALTLDAAAEPSDGGVEVIPPSLDGMEPGVFLAAVLDHTDVGRLAPHDRVTLLRAHQRMAAHHVARSYQAMAAITAAMEQDPDEGDWAEEAAAPEIGAALHLTRRAADTELELALDLTGRHPAVLEALRSGLIDQRRARVIVDGTVHLNDDTAQAVVEGVIDEASELTTGQLSARLRRLCIEAQPEEAEDRYRTAVEQRSVSTQPTTDGTTHLFAMDLPPDRVAAAMANINRQARDLRRAGETRTMDQLRADVLLNLLSGTTPAPGHGVVDIHVDLTTLVELNDHPGDLAGYGPVIADIARQVAENQTRSQWRWTITDPDTGALIDAGTTRRRPTAAQRRFVEARDRTCVFPGCRMPATTSDLDHTTPWAEHHTATTNLAPPLPPPPQPQDQPRLGLPNPPQRQPHLDLATRPHLHHQRPIPVGRPDPPPAPILGLPAIAREPRDRACGALGYPARRACAGASRVGEGT